MKKSKYISKYDYIAYYTKPSEYWFFTNDEIVASLEALYKKYSKSKNRNLLFNEQYDESNDDNEVEDELDFLELYKISKEDNKNVDKQNPQIIEGLIIDQKTKEFVIAEYSSNIDFFIVDFDDEKYNKKNMEELASITKKIILENTNLIIFQPVFIFENTITKPDALIKINDEITIIETKGTSSIKRLYFLDLFFQKNVIESQKYLIDMNCTYNYKLCVVKYELLNKNDISFVISDYYNYQKTYAKSSTIKNANDIRLTALEKIGYPINKDSDIDEPTISFNKILSGDFSELDERAEINKSRAKGLNNVKENLLIVINEYEDVINKLWNHKIKMTDDDLIKNINPSPADKGYFKTFDYFAEARKIYSLMGFNRMDYSGTFAKQTGKDLENIKKNEPVKDFIKVTKNSNYDFVNMFSIKGFVQVDTNQTMALWSKLKEKKVYFDFETLNPAIRVMDKTLPFAQIVTQCSIIKDDGFGIEENGCVNLIVDPLEINLEWYKKIIDAIYEGDNYSYVVYNKTFEKGRLNEMAIALNIPEYAKKVDCIIKNIYDIADFFSISNKNGYRLFFEELKGFYSIKKVLPLIEKHAPNIFNETHCHNYNDLEISNGKICQDKTAERFFKLVSDDDWLYWEDQMKIYCENDVRAMIAVEYFIRDILHQKIKFN